MPDISDTHSQSWKSQLKPMKKSACGKHSLPQPSPKQTQSFPDVLDPSINWVEVYFHYPEGLVGHAIALYQRLLGFRHYRFSHVSFKLSNGERFDRCWGETHMGITTEPKENTVRVLVASPCSNAEIAARAFRYFNREGESLKFDCAAFTNWCLLASSHYTPYPADLYRLYAPQMQHVLDTLARPIYPTRNSQGNATITERDTNTRD